VNRDDWNERYAAGGLVWGEAPNRFVAAETAGLTPGTALDLACGEGRNAVWLAERGWRVTAVDYADVAIARARQLAARRGVEVELVVGDVLTAPLATRAHDLVVVAYLQLPPHERRTVLERAADALAPGGTLLLVGHDLRNHAEGHGGPKDPSLLWTADDVVAILAAHGLEIERAGEVLRSVEEAPRPAIDTLVRARRPLASP
jgi:SAM-dependent methyltransferase